MGRKPSWEDFGLHLVIGLPGSGKSYWAARWIAEYDGDRPVYTNLPINREELELYARRRGRAAAEVVHVQKAHFERFVALLARVKDEMDERVNRGVDVEVAREEALKVVPGRVNAGPDANWIPQDAVVILDELQNWYRKQDKEEAPEVLRYFTMFRHMGHLLYVLSQRANNLSGSVRTMAESYTFCQNKGRVPVFFGIRVRLQWFLYVTYVAEDVPKDGRVPRRGVSPIRVQWQWPKRSVFRLYSSFSMSRKDQVTEELKEQGRPGCLRRVGCLAVVLFGVVMVLGMVVGGGSSKKAGLPARSGGARSWELAARWRSCRRRGLGRWWFRRRFAWGC